MGGSFFDSVLHIIGLCGLTFLLWCCVVYPTFNHDVPISTLGSFGHQHVSPRGLLASYLRTLVCVEGIVTKCTSVRPKLMKSVHFNPSNQSFTSREYRDSTAVELGLGAGGR